MIYFAELFMTSGQHAAFNGAMLQVLAKAFPGEKISLFAAKSHYEQLVAKQGPMSAINYQPVHVVPNKSGSFSRWLLKFLNEFVLIIKVLIRSRKKSVKLVYFSFLSPVGQYIVSIYARYMSYKGQQILITLHGLDILHAGKTQKRIDRLYAKLLKKAFTHSAAGKHYIVLEERIANYLTQNLYLQSAEIIHIPHPYHFEASGSPRADKPLIFAHLGVARLAKNSHLFFDLASRFATEISRGELVFQVVGPVLPELSPYLNPWVQYINQETFLSHATYQKSCQQAHYALFFYDDTNYTLTSSGAVMDAIAYRLPMLALNSPVFDSLRLISSSFPGKIYENIAAMYNDIQELIKTHSVKYRHFEAAFVAFQDYYSVEHVATQLARELVISDSIDNKSNII